MSSYAACVALDLGHLAPVEELRKSLDDKALARWPAHINLLWPFAQACEPSGQIACKQGDQGSLLRVAGVSSAAPDGVREVNGIKFQDAQAAHAVAARVGEIVRAFAKGETSKGNISSPAQRAVRGAARGYSLAATRAPAEIRLILADFGYFDHGTGSATIYIRPETLPPNALVELNAALEAGFKEFNPHSAHGIGKGFQPHLTVGQVPLREAEATIKRLRADWSSISMELDCIHILSRLARGRFSPCFEIELPRPKGRATNAVAGTASYRSVDYIDRVELPEGSDGQSTSTLAPAGEAKAVRETAATAGTRATRDVKDTLVNSEKVSNARTDIMAAFDQRVARLMDLFQTQNISLSEFDRQRNEAAADCDRELALLPQEPDMTDGISFVHEAHPDLVAYDIRVGINFATSSRTASSNIFDTNDLHVEVRDNGRAAADDELDLDSFTQPSGGGASIALDALEKKISVATPNDRYSATRLPSLQEHVDDADLDVNAEDNSPCVDVIPFSCVACGSRRHVVWSCPHRGKLRKVKQQIFDVDRGLIWLYEEFGGDVEASSPSKKGISAPKAIADDDEDAFASSDEGSSNENVSPKDACVFGQHLLSLHAAQKIFSAVQKRAAAALASKAGAACCWLVLPSSEVSTAPTSLFICRDDATFFCGECEQTLPPGEWRVHVATSAHPSLQRDVCLNCLLWILSSSPDGSCFGEDVCDHVAASLSISSAQLLQPYPDFTSHLNVVEREIAQVDAVSNLVSTGTWIPTLNQHGFVTLSLDAYTDAWAAFVSCSACDDPEVLDDLLLNVDLYGVEISLQPCPGPVLDIGAAYGISEEQLFLYECLQSNLGSLEIYAIDKDERHLDILRSNFSAAAARTVCAARDKLSDVQQSLQRLQRDKQEGSGANRIQQRLSTKIHDLKKQRTKLLQTVHPRPDILRTVLAKFPHDFVDATLAGSVLHNCALGSCDIFGAILASRVLEFLTGAELISSAELMWKWLRPGGVVMVVADTPYLGNWKRFLPVYERRKAAGELWPGFIESTADIEDGTTAATLPPQMHLLDDDVLVRVFTSVGFEIVHIGTFTRPGLPTELQLAEGHDSVGMIARKPAR